MGESKYTMNNRLCDGLMANDLSTIDLLAFQERLNRDEVFRAGVANFINEKIYVHQSISGVIPFQTYARSLGNGLMEFLLDMSAPSNAYYIIFDITPEAEDLNVQLTRTDNGIVAEPYAENAYCVFGGAYEALITAPGFEDTLVVFDTATDADDRTVRINIELTPVMAE